MSYAYYIVCRRCPNNYFHSTLAGQIIDQISLCSRKPAILSFEEGGGSGCECLPGLPMTLSLCNRTPGQSVEQQQQTMETRCESDQEDEMLGKSLESG